MSGGIKRVVHAMRGRDSQNSQARNNTLALPKQAAEAPDAVYAAALTVLGNEVSAGQLDRDLASAAARRLGHQYREKYLINAHGAAQEQNAEAERLAVRAYRIREELGGSGPLLPTGKLLSDLDAAANDLRKRLLEVGRLNDLAGNRVGGTPKQDQRLPGGWEQSVIDSAARLQVIADHVGKLTQMHADAFNDYETVCQQGRQEPSKL